MDWTFWYLIGSGFAIGWLARSHAEYIRRVEQRRVDLARRLHPSTRPLHRVDSGWDGR